MATKRQRPVILTQAHYDQLDNTLTTLGHLPDVIDNAELCDVDCQEYRNAHAYLVDKLTKMKQKFFPKGRPAS